MKQACPCACVKNKTKPLFGVLDSPLHVINTYKVVDVLFPCLKEFKIFKCLIYKHSRDIT